MLGGRAEKTERVQALAVLPEEHEVVGYQSPKTVLRQVSQERDDRTA